MRNRSDSAAQSTRSHSASDLKRGMGMWVWNRRPARIVRSFGDGTYEVEYLGDRAVSDRVNRNDLDPMESGERTEYLQRPRLEQDREPQGDRRTPIRKLMDEWPLSRARMIRLLGFSPPKVDRLIAENYLPLEVAVLIAILLDIDVDAEILQESERPFLKAAMEAAREGAREVDNRDARSLDREVEAPARPPRKTKAGNPEIANGGE